MYTIWKVQDDTVKAQTHYILRLYFRVTISILCIFYDISTQNITSEFNLLIKESYCGVYIVWKIQDGTVKAQTQSLFRLYFRVTISILSIFYDSSTRNISLKFNLSIKITVLYCYCRWEVNVDFLEIQASELLLKLGF